VHQVGNQYIVNSRCTVRKTLSCDEANSRFLQGCENAKKKSG